LLEQNCSLIPKARIFGLRTDSLLAPIQPIRSQLRLGLGG
jgi:hypothetical protein